LQLRDRGPELAVDRRQGDHDRGGRQLHDSRGGDRRDQGLRSACAAPGQKAAILCSGGAAPHRIGRVSLDDAAKELLRSGALGHLVTINEDGSPQVSCVWVAVDGDELLTAHLDTGQRKLENVRRDPRVALSFEGSEIQEPGMRQYVVVHGTAAIEEGGAPELLQELAYVYLGPDVEFPPMEDPPPGVRLRISVERIGGIGPWAG
jgi:PPOX class probable F420-dependent enzyme